MGNCLPNRDHVDEKIGMTDREKRLVRQSWRRFCDKNSDYGVLLFLGMFTKHPEYILLFQNFKGKNVRQLQEDHKFRAHAYAVGHQMSAMVESLDDTLVFVELARKNASKHLTKRGVRPEHFEGLFSAALGEMVASDPSSMTAATVKAWGRLFEAVNLITKSVFDEAAEFLPGSKKLETPADRPSSPAIMASPEATSQASTALPASGKSNIESASQKIAKKPARKKSASEKPSNLTRTSTR